MNYLGLDVSTNCTGYCVIDHAEMLVDIGFVDTSKENSWLEKALCLRTFLQLHPVKDVIHVCIEDIMQKFSSRMSTAKTIISLARFNGLATYFCHEKYGILPEHLNVKKARSICEITIPKGIQAKEVVLQAMQKKFPTIFWPTMKKKNSLSKSCFDMADAAVIALACKRMHIRRDG